jgi:hypothetical protein
VSGSANPQRELRVFRERLYAAFNRRADALFELTDAALTAGAVPSPPHLSLAPVHRRGWCSLYAALKRGKVDDEALRDLLVRHLPGNVAPPIFTVDVSVWPRCDAGQVRPEEDANDVAAEQVEALAHRLPQSGAAPLFVFDAGYDPVRLQRNLEGCRAQILVRLHSGRVFYADPPIPKRQPIGRPCRHGEKFDCKNPSTWPAPDRDHRCTTADYGLVRVRSWSGLHPKTRRAAERYGSESACVVRGTVVLVEVERLPRGERRRKPKALWLWWNGSTRKRWGGLRLFATARTVS